MTRLIDKDAYRHYAPKELHVLLNGFDDYLAQLMVQDQNVKNMVENPFAMFSTQASFPIIHLTALLRDGKCHFIRHPGVKRREGHRVVAEPGSDDLPGMMPSIRFEVVSDPKLTRSVDRKDALEFLARHANDAEPLDDMALARARVAELQKLAATTGEAMEVEKPAVIFSAPIVMIKKGIAQRFLHQRFTLYQHIIGAGHEYPNDGPFYIGITARDWKKRWAEHRAAILRGSMLKFHKVYRERVLDKKLTYVHHMIMGVAPTLERIQDLEEAFVAGHWHDTRLLNMIPGGRAGIAYLHEHAILGRTITPTPDNIERVLEEWIREHPRKGLPAPWVAEKWKDDAYALKIICGPEGRLSIDQVVAIRNMAAGGLSAEKILASVGAKNLGQVERVMAGKTYSRVTAQPATE